MIQDTLLSMGKYGCLAICYIRAVNLFLMGEELDTQTVKVLFRASREGAGLGKDMYVSNPATLMGFAASELGRRLKRSNVVKRDISSLDDIDPDKFTAVGWRNNGMVHFTLFHKGREYDSLDDSNCRKGEPFTAREISME